MASPVIRPVRARLAPSPTGFMHVGTLRTVLYDYFLVRQSGGQLILRIEDTDQERLVPGALESLLKTLHTLGIDYDEGPYLRSDGTIEEKGEYGPYVQSHRLDTYRPVVDRLLASGHAYHCFCSSETLDEMRRIQTASKLPTKYDRRCLALSAEEVKARLTAQASYVVRLKVPEGTLSFEDAIRGVISFQSSEVDDAVILKSDGFPTYHLAVVVDDHLMKITHVLRGEEWTSSTPKQIMLHQALGWEMPVYAHVPLLLNPDKTKLSKRKGDVSIESYLAKGYLPEALINFLALLGWNPTSDREIFTRAELIELFDLRKVNHSGAVMNMEKLDWTNAYYIKQLTLDRYFQLCDDRSVFTTEIGTDKRLEELRAAEIAKERAITLNDIPVMIAELALTKDHLEYDPAIVIWKKSTKEETKTRLDGVRTWIHEHTAKDFTSMTTLETALRAWIVEKGWGNGDTLWPLRVALSGKEKSPSPFELLYVLQKERSLQRIDDALAYLA